MIERLTDLPVTVSRAPRQYRFAQVEGYSTVGPELHEGDVIVVHLSAEFINVRVTAARNREFLVRKLGVTVPYVVYND